MNGPLDDYEYNKLKDFVDWDLVDEDQDHGSKQEGKNSLSSLVAPSSSSQAQAVFASLPSTPSLVIPSSPAQESDDGWPVLPPALLSSPPSSPTAESMFSVVPQKRPNLSEFSESNIIPEGSIRTRSKKIWVYGEY